MQPNTDIRADAAGSVVVLTPLTSRGSAWMRGNLYWEPWQEYAGGIVCELRQACDAVEIARARGLSVSTANFWVA